tara:strand:+ start:312 stop:515 length:204 start_codon:yes stop_codon:yes gene_type:complete
MAKMPKNIELTNSSGASAILEFGHALALLRLQSSQGREDWTILSDKYIFQNNEIVRNKHNKKDKEEA